MEHEENYNHINEIQNINNGTMRGRKYMNLSYATKKIIHAFKKIVHRFIKSYTGFNFYEPTIKAYINKEENYINFFKKKLYDVYINTLPKRVKGDKNLKDKEDENRRTTMKTRVLKNYEKSINAKKEEEKKLMEKPITAILDLTLLDFLKIFLEYGYENNNLTIKIDEQKYGFSEIKLDNFKTYSEIRYEFSKDEAKLEKYRTHLKEIVEKV